MQSIIAYGAETRVKSLQERWTTGYGTLGSCAGTELLMKKANGE